MSEIRWTTQQTAAIRSEDDTLLVANAGTGKTTTVVGKIMWLLGLPYGVDPETGEPPAPPEHPCELHEIAAITFTEKAAYDLKRQLRAAIEQSARADELRWEIDRASVGTIHSFCGELLRENALRLGIDPTFVVMDGDEAWAEQDRLIKELVLERLEAGDPAARLLLQRMKLTGWTHTKGVLDHVRAGVRELRWHGERCDARALAPAGDALDSADAAILEICDAILGLAREARRRWDDYLEAENRRDFDSLILGARELLVGGGEGSAPEAGPAPRSETGAGAALRAIRARYRILIVDEFQDTDFAQRDIAFAIGRGHERPQLFLVGDPKQSIYRFRGADIAVWNEVEAAFRDQGGRILELSQTFRNAPPIVEFVNHAARRAIEETGQALDDRGLAGGIHYAELIPAVDASETAGVEWQVAEGKNAAERRESEAKHVATWIRDNVGRLEIRDPDVRDPDAPGARRKLAFRDCAVLYRARSGLEHFEQALTRYDVPYYVAGASYLNERQEIVDVLNALHVLQAPRDDLRAFGFLRSPFVGLRDETIARIRLLSESRAPLLVQARRALDGEWPEAPDHPELAAIEREALGRGLDLLDDLRALCPRLPLDELIDELLGRSGYRLHVLLMDRPEEVLANLQSLVHFAEAYRHLDLSGFFEVWERSASQEIGIPQAPLYSKDDDVVTLSTIHAAKGLEWPVVFVVGVDKAIVRHRSNEFWTDRELGPVFCLKKDDRGPRADEIAEREQLEAAAEEARLLYVATTRARDRLQIVGERGGAKGLDQWLEAGTGQEDADGRDLVAIRNRPADIDPPAPARPPALAWLDACELTDPPALVEPLPEPPYRWIHSATELMLERRDPEAWKRRYHHGVLASWEFAPEAKGAATEVEREEAGDTTAGADEAAPAPALPATLRGTIIHGVLEKLENEAELSRILDETIGSLDEPELESMLSPGARYREALEAEIRRVVESPEWAWYTSGELARDYWKELTFTHLVGPRDWRYGAFDLFRRADGEGDDDADGDGARGLIVDFKTHPVSAERAAGIARDYRIQADVYRAAGLIAGADVDVRLHFTGPNAVVEMPEAEVDDG
jgi:ATP-dependent exoDNAse (exonuclease V) beta subunit